MPGIHYKRQPKSTSFRDALLANQKLQSSYKAVCKGLKPYAKPYYRIKSTNTKKKVEEAKELLRERQNNFAASVGLLFGVFTSHFSNLSES